MEFKKGKYRHYKGKDYKVIDVVNHSETMEKMVLYMPLYVDPKYGEGALWVRPFDMFFEDVEIDGKKQPRFKFIE